MTAHDDNDALEIPRRSMVGSIIAAALGLLLVATIVAAALQVSGAYAGAAPCLVVCASCADPG